MADRKFDVRALIRKSWNNALNRGAYSEDTSNRRSGQANRYKASAWIDCLGEGFQDYYDNKDQRVFWRNNSCNSDFGLSELLFDISVCQIGWVKSISQRKLLPYIAKCLWQVESEFNNKNSREITKDFSKLVMGRSESQLFVSTFQGNQQEQVLSMCSKIASCCKGNLYLCFIEHPEDWSNSPKSPSLFKWEYNEWSPS